MNDLVSLAFFTVMREIVRSRIDDFMTEGIARMFAFVSAISITMFTLWLMIQGYRILTGESSGSLMAFVVRAGKVVFILSVASGVSSFGSNINGYTHDFQRQITKLVTGKDKDVYTMVDQSLLKTQLIMTGVSTLVAAADPEKKDDKSLILAASAFGSAGPAVIAGTLSLLNEIAVSLAVVFAPLFILALIFENTKSLFWNWLRYTVGVMFSMAVLAMVTGIALDISIAYAGLILASAVFNSIASSIPILGDLLAGDSASLTQTAIQQGGLGLVLSMLLLTVPPLVMQFFSTSLGGAVTGYSPFSAPGKEAVNNPAVAGPKPTEEPDKTMPGNQNVHKPQSQNMTTDGSNYSPGNKGLAPK